MLSYDYSILFNIAFKHDYAKTRVTNDLVCVPTEATASVIKRHQLIFKVVNGGIQIIQRSNAGEVDPISPLPNGTPFTFTLKINNANFLHHTSVTQVKGESLFFSENENNAEMDLSSVAWRDPKFEFSFHKNGLGSANINIYDLAGKKYFTIPTKGKKGTITEDIDLSGLPDGPYRIQVVAKSKEKHSEIIYVNRDLNLSQTFGLIHLTYPFVSDFTLNFPTLSSAWKYYVIPKKELTLFDLEIEDKQANDDTGRYAALDYSFEERPNDKIATLPLAHLFESGKTKNNKFTQTDIPMYEDPFTQLRLVKIDKQTNQRFVLIKNLPKPTVHQFKPEVFIYI